MPDALLTERRPDHTQPAEVQGGVPPREEKHAARRHPQEPRGRNRQQQQEEDQRRRTAEDQLFREAALQSAQDRFTEREKGGPSPSELLHGKRWGEFLTKLPGNIADTLARKSRFSQMERDALIKLVLGDVDQALPPALQRLTVDDAANVITQKRQQMKEANLLKRVKAKFDSSLEQMGIKRSEQSSMQAALLSEANRIFATPEADRTPADHKFIEKHNDFFETFQEFKSGRLQAKLFLTESVLQEVGNDVLSAALNEQGVGFLAIEGSFGEALRRDLLSLEIEDELTHPTNMNDPEAVQRRQQRRMNRLQDALDSPAGQQYLHEHPDAQQIFEDDQLGEKLDTSIDTIAAEIRALDPYARAIAEIELYRDSMLLDQDPYHTGNLEPHAASDNFRALQAWRQLESTHGDMGNNPSYEDNLRAAQKRALARRRKGTAARILSGSGDTGQATDRSIKRVFATFVPIVGGAIVGGSLMRQRGREIVRETHGVQEIQQARYGQQESIDQRMFSPTIDITTELTTPLETLTKELSDTAPITRESLEATVNILGQIKARLQGELDFNTFLLRSDEGNRDLAKKMMQVEAAKVMLALRDRDTDLQPLLEAIAHDQGIEDISLKALINAASDLETQRIIDGIEIADKLRGLEERRIVRRYTATGAVIGALTLGGGVAAGEYFVADALFGSPSGTTAAEQSLPQVELVAEAQTLPALDTDVIPTYEPFPTPYGPTILYPGELHLDEATGQILDAQNNPIPQQEVLKIVAAQENGNDALLRFDPVGNPRGSWDLIHPQEHTTVYENLHLEPHGLYGIKVEHLEEEVSPLPHVPGSELNEQAISVQDQTFRVGGLRFVYPDGAEFDSTSGCIVDKETHAVLFNKTELATLSQAPLTENEQHVLLFDQGSRSWDLVDTEKGVTYLENIRLDGNLDLHVTPTNLATVENGTLVVHDVKDTLLITPEHFPPGIVLPEAPDDPLRDRGFPFELDPEGVENVLRIVAITGATALGIGGIAAATHAYRQRQRRRIPPGVAYNNRIAQAATIIEQQAALRGLPPEAPRPLGRETPSQYNNRIAHAARVIAAQQRAAEVQQRAAPPAVPETPPVQPAPIIPEPNVGVTSEILPPENQLNTTDQAILTQIQTIYASRPTAIDDFTRLINSHTIHGPNNETRITIDGTTYTLLFPEQSPQENGSVILVPEDEPGYYVPYPIEGYLAALQPRLQTETLTAWFETVETTADPEIETFIPNPPGTWEITEEKIQNYVPARQVPFLLTSPQGNGTYASPISAEFAYDNPQDAIRNGQVLQELLPAIHNKTNPSYALAEAADNFRSGFFALIKESAPTPETQATLFRTVGNIMLDILSRPEGPEIMQNWLTAQGKLDPTRALSNTDDPTRTSLDWFFRYDHEMVNGRWEPKNPEERMLYYNPDGTYNPAETINLWRDRINTLRDQLNSDDPLPTSFLGQTELFAHMFNLTEILRDIKNPQVPAPAPAGDSGPGLGPTEAPTSAADAPEGDSAAEADHRRDVYIRFARTPADRLTPELREMFERDAPWREILPHFYRQRYGERNSTLTPEEFRQTFQRIALRNGSPLTEEQLRAALDADHFVDIFQPPANQPLQE